MAGINDYVMKEIYNKAKSGQGLSNATTEKQAIYDTYKANPSVATPKGISDFEMKEIIRKAQSGIQLSSPTAEKNAIYNAYSNIKKPQQDDFMSGYLNQINSIYDRQRQAQLEQYNSQRNKAVGQLSQQKTELAPAYASKRNEADVVNAQNVNRLRELMAANGLTGSGENVTSQTALGAARQGTLSQLNLQEQQQRNDLERRIADLNDPAELNALMAALDAEQSRALADAQRYADERMYQRERDAVSDGWRQNQWNYQTGLDSRNFNYQQQRDAVGDSQWQQQFNQSQKQYADEKAWREYTYRNMSASEKANMDRAASQFGEEMAWRMYEMEYRGELDKSIAQSQLNYYTP